MPKKPSTPSQSTPSQSAHHPTHQLSDAITQLPGVGPAVAEKLHKRDIHRISDLLFILPLRYQDRTQITPVSELTYGEDAQVLVTIVSTGIKYGQRRMFVMETQDDTGWLTIRLFQFGKQQTQHLTVGTQLLVYGQAQINSGNQRWAMMHPEYQVITPQQPITLTHALTPVYPSLLGIGTKKIQRWISLALNCLHHEPLLDLPEPIRTTHQLPDLNTALIAIHQPHVGQSLDALLSPDNPNLVRLVFDELLGKQIALLRQKIAHQSENALAFTLNHAVYQRLIASLPFALTGAQGRVIDDIFSDLQHNKPMHRLIQGDVGSGKTLVALTAVLQATANGLQAVIMAPTEVLSEQHYLQAERYLAPLGVSVAWLSGKATAKQRRETLAAIQSGEAQLIIGTHALFQADVIYDQLALVVIDEQHRFGVHQRLQLRDKARSGDTPHLLVMTATPIPRTLAMTFYADLDTSIIDELPPGRQPIETLLLPQGQRETLINRIQHIIHAGQQVYWVCPLIDESDTLQAQAAEIVYQQLSASLPDMTVGLLHGRLNSDEKTAIIAKFQANEIQLLVATTVIEVGVDVPNASLMVIESAERFGLAQLHQLRGRVGRGSAQSYCVLLYQAPLSDNAKKRLQVIRENHDGFAIAKADLDIRGAGEILGTKQTGDMHFRIADLTRDEAWIAITYPIAQHIVAHDPVLADKLVNRWVGSSQHYADI
ncbi:ATP-dependent DNA helicase RecG [Ostreibacterium oceani]|uniref:ATP-dependent DNA helicase RecG n=1 Tax=Ostreibacterium oceani TaxID=2654998 RepID=A0A6N7EWP3_9GAMM|nr:ATP-dependent DNA helicase RecG [Ostreibacterium oceani]MPV86333.1 ATP-dependent DNA helicase RecG [Ostreibacterium oceani]